MTLADLLGTQLGLGYTKGLRSWYLTQPQSLHSNLAKSEIK